MSAANPDRKAINESRYERLWAGLPGKPLGAGIVLGENSDRPIGQFTVESEKLHSALTYLIQRRCRISSIVPSREPEAFKIQFCLWV